MSVLAFPSTADTQARRDALDVDRSFLVEAPAGSGKTGLLIQRFLKLLTVVDQPDAILALTFTNKAAAEMRYRVLEALQAAAAPLPPGADPYQRDTWNIATTVLERDAALGWNLRSQPHRLNLRTIDSLCADIARSVPVLSGGIGQATPIPDANPLYRDAARAVLLQLGGSDLTLSRAIETILFHRDADLLDCEKLLAEMLGTREQWGNLIPLRSPSLDDAQFDRDVRPKLDAALETALCAAMTKVHRRFSPGLLQQVAALAHQVADAEGYRADPNPLAACTALPHPPGTAPDDLRHWQLLADLLLTKSGTWRSSKGLNVNQVGFRLTIPQKSSFSHALEELRPNDELQDLLCGIRDLPPAHFPDDQWLVVKALFTLLHHALIELKLLFAAREVCDFTELSIAARAALRNGEAVADTLGIRLEHLLVDEMQDTSSAQYELLEALTSNWDGITQTVFLVGDPKQSIYLFRQARVERFLHSMRTRTLGSIPLHTLRLTRNFRSGAHLVDRFNDTFSAIFADGATIGYIPAEPARPASPEDELVWHLTPALPGTETGITPDQHRLHREEAEAIAAVAWQSRRSDPHSTTAVLVRSRSHATLVLRKLAEAHVPYRAVDIEQLGERPEVLDALAITRALLHPADRTAWLAVLRAPWCGLSLADLHSLAAGDDRSRRKQALRQHLRSRAPLLPPDSQTRLLRTLDVFDRAIAHRGRAPLSVDVDRTWHALLANHTVDAFGHRNVRAYLELLERMEAAHQSIDADSLRDRLTRLYAQPDTAPGIVEVLTIHKAKGLEWDHVLIPSLHRIGQTNGTPLLDWMELPDLDPNGHPQILLAPIQKRGDDPSHLNRFLRKARTDALEAELQRLVYVAGTRARSTLQLFASPATKQDGTPSVLPNSLLRAAWPAAQQELHQSAATSPVAIPLPVAGLALAAVAVHHNEFTQDADSAIGELSDTNRAPLPLHRLPLASLLEPIPHLPADQHPDPHTSAASLRPTGSLAARALGNTVHTVFQHLAQSIANGDDTPLDVTLWPSRIRALVRGYGLPAPEADRVCADGLYALRNTVGDPLGLWLLQPHPRAINEGELFDSNTATGRIQRFRFDRSFLAGPTPGSFGSSVLWIVDYKTADYRDASHAGSAREQFLQRERDRYAAHLQNYATLALRSHPEGTPVMLALYHPMLPHLDAWPYQPNSVIDALSAGERTS